MSYCRWSSDNFTCDLYCYESNDGFVTHIAESRQRLWFRIFHYLTDKRFPMGKGETYRVWRFIQYFSFTFPRGLMYKKIKLPYAGESFTDPTEADMFKRIRDLISLGYKIPTYLQDEINAEPQ